MRNMISKHPEIGENERKEIAVETMSYLWVLTFNALMDYFGPEQGLRLVRPALSEFGARGALINKERLHIERNDLASLAEALDFVFNALTMESELDVDEEGQRIEWRITSCPFSRSSTEVCEAFEIITAKFVETFNQGLNGHHYQMMSKGCPHCLYVVETKEAFRERDLSRFPRGGRV